ncbi:MAG: TonB-dependent receptor [Alphaproteobacteria bacterium]|nr:TonB-dependent receptor [Alphaproteobacteria bacterium]
MKRIALLGGISLIATAVPVLAQTGKAPAEHVIVYGTLPDSDIGLSANQVPGLVQSFSADRLTAQHGPTVLNALGAQAAGVSLSDVQGNSMFQDLRFHGFEASPLQGTPQGIAVYQNGVRLNEAFGDTVNWDAVPQAAIARMDVWSSNPVFGLNALGGSVNMIMKNGFTWQGVEASLQGGSYGHGMASAQWGMDKGGFSFYGAAEGVTDAGWRFHSQSGLARLYADVGWRFGDSQLHLVASGAATSLGVVGPTPIGLIQRNAKSVYTFPQITRNSNLSLALNGKTRLDGNWQVEASVYMRAAIQRHVGGNDTDFERCSNSSSFVGKLCLQDDAFTRPVPFTGAAALNFRNQFAILDQAGAAIPFTAGVIYGTVDRTYSDSTTTGATLQVTGNAPLLGFGNYLTAGFSFDGSGIGFRSTSTSGRIYPDFNVAVDQAVAGAGSIVRSNGNIGYAPVTLGATTNYVGFYAVDALDLTDALTLTAGFRVNAADIVTRDRSGTAAELNGVHGYGHVNPLVGLTWKFSDAISAFGGYSEANRAPTPLELDCADPNLPCLLEGSLVSDPPLAQVVSHTYQAGLRGNLTGLLGDDHVEWSASLFRTDSDNDIVALASTVQGRGYFTNVPTTQRQGVDLSARYQAHGWSAYASYSYLDATYQFTGTLASPNNPKANAAGNITVTPGRRMPMNPANTVRAGTDVDLFDDISIGVELAFTGSQYFDGDQSNLNAKLPATVVVNLRAAWQFDERWQLFGTVDNLFDNRDALYGAYFDPSSSIGLVTPVLTDPRTLTLRQPVTFQLGLKLKI